MDLVRSVGRAAGTAGATAGRATAGNGQHINDLFNRIVAIQRNVPKMKVAAAAGGGGVVTAGVGGTIYGIIKETAPSLPALLSAGKDVVSSGKEVVLQTKKVLLPGGETRRKKTPKATTPAPGVLALATATDADYDYNYEDDFDSQPTPWHHNSNLDYGLGRRRRSRRHAISESEEDLDRNYEGEESRWASSNEFPIDYVEVKRRVKRRILTPRPPSVMRGTKRIGWFPRTIRAKSPGMKLPNPILDFYPSVDLDTITATFVDLFWPESSAQIKDNIRWELDMLPTPVWEFRTGLRALGIPPDLRPDHLQTLLEKHYQVIIF